MPLVTASADLVERLGQLRLPDAKLIPVAFRTLWTSSSAILVHLNSFGSLSGREQVQALIEAIPDFAAAGVGLTVIGAGDAKSALDFIGKLTAKVSVLCDPELRSYEMIGEGHRKSARRTSTSALQNEVKLLRNSSMDRKSGPNAQLVLGATHVIRVGGELSLCWLNDRTGGVCPVVDILAALEDDSGRLGHLDEEEGFDE